MRTLAALGILCLGLNAGETPASNLWSELKHKKETGGDHHQEFEVTLTFRGGRTTQTVKQRIVLDMSGPRWRENFDDGFAARVRIFDGRDLFSIDEAGEEFIRAKRKPNDPDPIPIPYLEQACDWSKALDLGRARCSAPWDDRVCAVLQVPLKAWSKVSSSVTEIMSKGSASLMVDTATGLVLELRTAETVQRRNVTYFADQNFVAKSVEQRQHVDPSLFQLPSDNLRGVKEFAPWSAAKIRKQFAGKAAPELAAHDMQGRAVTLAGLKGKTVLLDFWTTWCPPCRADAPQVEDLARKYGDRDLAIIGISVNEDRTIVEPFLHKHPVSFPIVLTTENDMPRPYRAVVLPTYIVIDREGRISAAVEGDHGFYELRRLLKQAGLVVD